jgi:hypothetical protein
MPSAFTVAVPIVPPPGAVIVTIAPGSPVPVTLVPSPATTAEGAPGAVVSGAVIPAGREPFPARSVWTTVSA